MNIRCSMLPSYPDCPRRSAAKMLKRQLGKMGFEIRETRPSVGAAAGTAVHAVNEHVLKCKIDTGTLGSLKDGLESAMVGFDEEVGEGCEWDDTTPNRSTAQKQIERMARAYYHGPAQRLDPLAVELELEADAGDGYLLTGHIDLVTRDGWVRDAKTGALLRPYFTQLGGYSLLCRSQKALPEVKGLAIDFVKRTPASRPQDAAIEQVYPVGPCEAEAFAVVDRIKCDIQNFTASEDPGAFTANPMSMMCGAKYCPAHGTDFCELTKGG